jgi:hypothetical protein
MRPGCCRRPVTGGIEEPPADRVNTDLPAERDEPLPQLVGLVEDFHGAIARTASERPLHRRSRRVPNRGFVFLDRRQLVNEENAAMLVHALGDACPEAIEALRRDVREPGAEEHHVVAPVGLPVEDVRNDEANAIVVNALGGDREHLRRGVIRWNRTSRVVLAGARSVIGRLLAECDGVITRSDTLASEQSRERRPRPDRESRWCGAVAGGVARAPPPPRIGRASSGDAIRSDRGARCPGRHDRADGEAVVARRRGPRSHAAADSAA